MARLALSSGIIPAIFPNPSPFSHTYSHLPKSVAHIKIHAKLGGGDGDVKRPEKKFIIGEEEPEHYWQPASEREGENPMKTYLPHIITFGMTTPFVILLIAFANCWIKVPVR